MDFDIGESDSLLLEDEERNEEQAERNQAMRSRLFNRKPAAAALEKKPVGLSDEKITLQRAGSFAVAKVNQEGVASNVAPWCREVKCSKNKLLCLHEEILDFIEFMEPTQEEKDARDRWIQRIQGHVRELWPGAKLRTFGSYYTNLFLPNADVDMTLVDVPIGGIPALRLLSNNLLKRGHLADVEIVEKARVPIAKFVCQRSGLRADISVSSDANPMATSDFICARMKEFPVMRPLVMFLKFFLLQRELNETYQGGIGSYLLTCMVTHFLQICPASSQSNMYQHYTLAHYVIQFFKYYGQDFDYERYGISIRDDRDRSGVFRKESRGWYNPDKKWQLCLESPLEPDVDIGGKAWRMRIIRVCFTHAFHCLWTYIVSEDHEGSALCPLLFTMKHPVISKRHELLNVMPPAVTKEELQEMIDGPVRWEALPCDEEPKLARSSGALGKRSRDEDAEQTPSKKPREETIEMKPLPVVEETAEEEFDLDDLLEDDRAPEEV